MKYFRGLAVAAGMTIASAALAVTPAKSPDTKEVRPTMQAFAQELEDLLPYLSSRRAFKDPANQAEIAKRIQVFHKLAENAKHLETMKQPDFKPTLRILQDHLSASERYFKGDHKDLARAMLQSTVQLCISCHGRLPSKNATTVTQFKKSAGLTPFENAQYLFATRQFDEAARAYTDLIKKYPRNDLEVPYLIDSLDNLATIYARIKRDPASSVKPFEKIVKRGNLPDFLEEDIAAWVHDFKNWSKETPFELDKHNDSEVIQEARRILAGHMHEDLSLRNRAGHIAYLRASGLLHEFLTKRPKSADAAEAYYLLGVCYSNLDQNFYFGFDDLYFKICISEYPKAAIAKSCYRRLEQSVYLGYSGSAGANIPLDVMQELNEYKKLIK